MTDLVLGVDGGGTGCRAAVAAASGPILGIGTGGAANILTDPEGAVTHIEAAARAALADAGLSPDLIHSIPALLGLAGNNVRDVVNRVMARLPFSRSEICSDGLIALEGALGSRDGAIASLGTGTVYLLRHRGEVRQLGGWGFFLGDGGSGARIGQDALRETLLVHDEVGAPTLLTQALFAEFGQDPGAMLAFARHATPKDFAQFAPKVFAMANAGDRAGRKVVEAGAGEVDAVLDRMLAITGPTPLVLVGGLAALYPSYLGEAHKARLTKPLGDALAGAISLARSTFLVPEAVS